MGKVKGQARARRTLVCTECSNETYRLERNSINTPDKLEQNKHCKHCKKHTVQKEK